MEVELPIWLNEAFFEKVLQGGEDKEPKVTVLNFDAKLAVAPGNNYLSHLFRVNVEYQEEGKGSEVQKTALMVKAPITKGIIGDMSESMDVFTRELRVYTELLPKINEKLGLQINPEMLYCPVKALIMKDLNKEGYFMSDKSKQLDFHQCQLAISTLAKFHAASVACYNEDPDLITSIGKEQMFFEDNPMIEQFKPWLQICIKTVSATVAEIEECKAGSEFLLSRSDDLFESVLRITKPKESGLNVLNHGDFWMNNMMFKSDESGKAIAVKFIDFQMPRFTSPALDLMYSLWISANKEVRESKTQELFFDTYLKTLNAVLDELGCTERLSEEELRTDLKNSIDWGIMAICNVLPMALIEAENAMNMEEISKEDLANQSEENPDERFMKAFKGKTFTTLIPKIIENFYNWATSLG